MKNILCKMLSVAAMVFALTAINTFAQVATGGNFTLNQAVTGNGGGDSMGGNFSITATAGQSAAGTQSNGGNFSTRSGFWTYLLVPTAANASVSGRVITANGRGIRNSIIMLTGGSLTTPIIRRTGSFGYFKFDDVEIGQVYVISVVSKTYGFTQSSQVISVTEDLTGILFQADWVN
jgi:hypothetical protein